MSLYAQHGYGKSDKIERGIFGGQLGGTILSPRDEKPVSMIQYVNDLRLQYPNAEVLFDPQFYVSTFNPAKEGNLSSFSYYRPNLTRRDFVVPSDIASYVKDTIDFQVNLGLTKIISPSIFFDSFSDPWSQIALSLAHQSQSYHLSLSNVPPLLVSVCFSESALNNLDSINEFLDMLSLLDVQGFYIILRRDGNNGGPTIEPKVLQNLMYFCYALSTINQYEVILGYTDFVGIPIYCTGITAISCGWYNSLREFTVSHFQPATGGRRPLPRYSSQQLLNSLLIIPELDTINKVGLLSNVISNTMYDTGMMRTNPANAAWPADISCLHHWEILNRYIAIIDSFANVSDKLDYIIGEIDRSQKLYRQLTRSRVVFESKSSNIHLSQWETAITEFRTLVGV